MSLDKFASADAAPPKASSAAVAPPEPDEDLFNFDELSVASSKVAAEMRQELDDALLTVDVAKNEVASAVLPTPVAAAPLPRQRRMVPMMRNPARTEAFRLPLTLETPPARLR